MKRLFDLMFGREPARKNTDAAVERARGPVQEALKGLDNEVLVLMQDALKWNADNRVTLRPRRPGDPQ